MLFKPGDKARIKNNPYRIRVALLDKECEIIRTTSYAVGGQWDEYYVVIVPTHGIAEYAEDFEFQIHQNDLLSLPASPQLQQEAPCQVCGRNNDLGVKICWCCGNSPF